MSGVLERMAKRALGKLPTVQPLIRPIYAAPPINAGEPIAPGLLLRKNEAETSAATPTRTPVTWRESPPVAPHRGAPKPAAQQLDAPRAPAAAAPVTGQGEPAVPQATRRSAETREGEPSGIPSTRFSPEAAGLEPMTLTAPAALSREDEIAPRVRELAAHAQAALHIGQPMVPALQSRRLRAASRESVVPAEQKPEIHISIGSIELRAAPTESKPQASAPFRPRVSLQDFLSRDRGARR